MRARHEIAPTEPTRYEIVARNGDESFTIGFTRGTSRAALLAAMRRRADEIIQRCGVGEDDQMTFGFDHRGSTSFAYALTNGWKIGFSGRTERDASAADRQPSLGSAPSAAAEPIPLTDAERTEGDPDVRS